MTTPHPIPGVSMSHDRVRKALAIEERPGWIAGVQTPLGQSTLAALTLWICWPALGPWAACLAVLASLWSARHMLTDPVRHTQILFAATWASVLLATLQGELDTADRVAAALTLTGLPADRAPVLATLAVALTGLAMAGALAWVSRRPQQWLARRPMLALLGFTAALTTTAALAADWNAPASLTASLWIALFVWTPYLWFLPYAIVDLRSRSTDPVLPQLAVLRPYWSPTYLPFGKGLAFLRRHRAQTPDALAVTQLKAGKLLLWALLLDTLRNALGSLLPGIPSVQEAVAAYLAGQPHSILAGWGALVLSTARFGLQVAVWAHIFIGLARLAGYRLPRGSWRPLESRTLMDYFNRFHYYFKEVLVDFFFVPTFFRIFKSHPRLRMFFATFMAAGVGNALWHFLRDIDLVATLGPAQALQTYTSYAFYCAVLATGIGLSQVRAQQGRKPADGMTGRLWSFVVVWGFVVLLHVFSDGSRTHTLEERMRFLLSLFGV